MSQALTELILILTSTGILIGFIAIKVWPNFIANVEKRKNDINLNIDNANENNIKSEELLNKRKRELEKIYIEKEDIIKNSIESGNKQGNKIIMDSNEKAKNIIINAKKEIENEKKLMQQELQKESLNYVNLIAEKFILEKISDEDELKMYEDAIKKVD